MRLSRITVTAVGVIATATLLAGCVGSKNNNASAGSSANQSTNAAAKSVTLTISANDIAGGKNAAEAGWITDTVIPGYVAMEKAKGVTAQVSFTGAGVDDGEYKTKLQLGLSAGNASDVFLADGIWLGEFASAGYVKPLSQVVGAGATSWDGWAQISKSVQQNTTYKGDLYGIPNGTDGRVLYFNKKLFKQAGLPADWQPKSWADILAAGAKLKTVAGVTPIQINAGTEMTEATTAQGFLPLLAGTGKPLFDDKTGKWQGATTGVKDVLSFYQKIYGGGLGDKTLQQDKSGRVQSFEEFSQGKIGILGESDYLWRSIICPDKKTCAATSMPTRNTDIGWAKFPAEKAGSGQNGQDFVSVSGGAGIYLNPHTKFPQQAWELMTYMRSKDAQLALSKTQVRISARADVNATTLASDPLLSFISKQVLPITSYRPSDENYDAVSKGIQQATLDVVSGKSVDDAANTYQSALQKLVTAAHVSTG